MKPWMLIAFGVFIALGWWAHYYEPEWMTREFTISGDQGEGSFYDAPTASNYPRSDYINYLKYPSDFMSSATAVWFSPPGYETVIRIPGSSNVDIQVRP